MAEGCRTVQVKGLSKQTLTETLENYFSSPRRGGEISSIEHDQENGTALITFISPEGMSGSRLSIYTEVTNSYWTNIYTKASGTLPVLFCC